MKIISQKFLTQQVKSIGKRQIKFLICRQRLKFTYSQISTYLWCFFKHQSHQINFKSLYKKLKLNITYQAFMHNILVLSPLIKFIFYKINKLFNIKISSLFNIIDSSLIFVKKPDSITQKDYDLHNVTTRVKEKIKIHICGVKLLLFINRFSKIYYAEILNINYSDHNILKSSALYQSKLKGFLLADKGFSNKESRRRILESSNCKMISPFHYKSKIQLTEKERKFYKKRWKIETVFQQLKNPYNEFKLNLQGAKNKKILEAKLFISLINYNLST